MKATRSISNRERRAPVSLAGETKQSASTSRPDYFRQCSRACVFARKIFGPVFRDNSKDSREALAFANGV